jgi:hypothetical protein
MRMRSEHLRPELGCSEITSVSVAFLDLVSWRSRMVAALREETGEDRLTVTDTNVLLHVFVFGMTDDHGSRVSDITNNLAVPRRTVRDSLAVWERLGVIVREEHRYYPATAAASLYNGWFNEHFRLLSKLCSTFTEYRRAIGR